MTAAQIEAAAAASSDWVDFGFASATLQREDFALPGGIGEYVYVGAYAGVGTLSDLGGLQVTSGTARLLLDILDFDNNGEVEGAIVGSVGARSRTTAGGTALVSLPSISLQTGSFDPATGSFVDGAVSTTSITGDGRDAGTYRGIIAGPNGESLGAVLVMTGVAEIQEVDYEVLNWELEVITPVVDGFGNPVLDLVTGDPLVEIRTLTGAETGLTDANREIAQAAVDAGVAAPLHNAPTTDIPAGATVTATQESAIFTSDYQAQEIGIIATDQVIPLPRSPRCRAP